MRHTYYWMAFGVLAAGQQPSGDQRIDENSLSRRFRHLVKRGWAGCNRLVAQTNRAQSPQHDRQCILNVVRQNIDHFVGTARNRSLKAAQRTIRREGEQSTVAAGLVECVENEFEKW